MSAHILTANDLVDGDVVYLTATNSWSGNISDAVIAHDEVELDGLTVLGKDALDHCKIVDPHTVPVDVNDDQIVPKHIKERIRAKGPTTHPQFGKQAEENAIANSFHSF